MGLGLHRFKVIAKDESTDPFRLTGSWFVARDSAEALNRAATYGGWRPGTNGRTILEIRYDLIPAGPAFDWFEGSREEWVESVRRGLITSSDLYFFVPEAMTEFRRGALQLARRPRRKIPVADRVERTMQTLSRYKHTVFWTLGLVGIALLVLGWIFFQRQLEAAFGSAVTVAVVAYFVWRILFRRRY